VTAFVPFFSESVGTQILLSKNGKCNDKTFIWVKYLQAVAVASLIKKHMLKESCVVFVCK